LADAYLQQLLAGSEVLLIDAKQHPIAVLRFALKPILLVGLVVLLLLFNQIFDFDGFLNILNEAARWILILAAIVAVIWLPIDIVQWYSRRYVLTSRRVIRMYGVVTKHSLDSSLEQINDIQSSQSAVGRLLGYTDLTIYTASNSSNESFNQLIDGLQFKKAVLAAKESLRTGDPMTELPEGLVVKGGTNEASMRAYQKQPAEAPASDGPAAAELASADDEAGKDKPSGV
jgi:uncharacterized membrane protein YdbT with pleckstrin-like domain